MIRRLCQHPCCSRFRVEGSKYCEKHRSSDEAKDKVREEERAKNRFANCKPSIYANLYQSARWKRESKAFIENSGRRCELCGRSDLRLQVHHNFSSGVDYTNEFFDHSHWLVLCASCHEKITHNRT